MASPVNVNCRVTMGLGGGPARKTHASSAIRPTIATPPSSAAIRVVTKRRRGAAWRVSAAANSATLANRSAGARANAWVTAASTPLGTCRSVVSLGIGSLKRLAMIACAVGPV